MRAIGRTTTFNDTRKFVAYFWFVGWSCLSLGFHIDVAAPNIELHVPFGFFRIGRESKPSEGNIVAWIETVDSL